MYVAEINGQIDTREHAKDHLKMSRTISGYDIT